MNNETLQFFKMEEFRNDSGNYTFDYNQTLNDYDEEFPEINIPVTIIVASVLYSLICAIGLLGNLLVIYVVSRYTTMQTVTNTYILNLAIADTCFLISIPFMIASIVMKSWPFGHFMCKTYMLSTGINQFTSSIFVCIMGADRYLALCRPTTARRYRTAFVTRIVSVLAWATSTLMMLPIIMYTKLIYVGDRASCNIVWPSGVNYGRTFILYNFVFGFAVPLFLTIVFYCLIINMLKNHRLQLPSVESTRTRQKVTNLVLAVISVYGMCWLPYWVLQLTIAHSSFDWNYLPTKTTIIVLSITASSLAYSNSAINPILYAFLSDHFRLSFMKACSWFVKNKEDANNLCDGTDVGKTEFTNITEVRS